MAHFASKKLNSPSQRQLRVGELVRHALAEAPSRGESGLPELERVLVSIAEVRMSPDLKHATALVSPRSTHEMTSPAVRG